jgi:hypothetical protein
MSKYFLFTSFLVFSGFQCFEPVEFDGSKKILYKGRIIDVNGRGIPNMHCEIAPFNEDEIDVGPSIANEAITDNDGRFTMIVSDDDAKFRYILVNRPYDIITHYTQPPITYILPDYESRALIWKDTLFNDFEVNIGDIVIDQGVPLTFECDPSFKKSGYYVKLNTINGLFNNIIMNQIDSNIDHYTIPCGKGTFNG